MIEIYNLNSMSENDIQDLIKNNEKDKLDLFFGGILEKSRSVDRQINFISILMILLILIYYLGEMNINSEIQIGPLKINDIKIIYNLFPLILSYLIFKFVILNAHRAEIKKLIKNFAMSYFKFENLNTNVISTDDFTRLVMPMNIYDELGKLSFKTKIGCISVFLTLPLSFIAISPYFLVITWIYPQLIIFKTLNFYNLFFLISTMWILVLIIYYIIKTMIIGFNESKNS